MKAMMFTAGLAIIFSSGCSDDTKPKPDINKIIDMKVTKDGPRSDMPVKKDGTSDAAVTKDMLPDSGQPQFSGQIFFWEVAGRETWGPAPTGDAGVPVITKKLAINLGFDPPYPQGNLKPDFIDSSAPPNCVGYKWTNTSPPAKTTGDAGTITITGHLQPNYFDLTGTSHALPATITCTRAALGPVFGYACEGGKIQGPLPAILTGPVLTDTTSLTVNVAGGTDVSAFTETLSNPQALVTLKGGIDLNQIDPSAAFKVQWETTDAHIVIVSIIAYLKDGSEIGQVACTQLAVYGEKDIPLAALNILPKPKANNPLIIDTAVLAAKLKQDKKTWGTYAAGTGRGRYGISCWTTTGQCPPP